MTARAIFGSERRRGRASLVLACMTVLAALWLLAASRIHVNTSWSDGAWGYLALPALGELEVGDPVLFEPAPTLGARVPYLKTVRGIPGDQVVVNPNRTVSVDGVHLGRAKTHALDGRSLEAIGSGTVPRGHYYLHGDHPDSHDSRYAEIGLVPRGRIFGVAMALPDLPWLGLEGPLVRPEDAGGPARVPARHRAGAVR